MCALEREQTTKFIMINYENIVYYPFEKPEWWNNEDEYVLFWRAINYDEAMKPSDYIITPWD